MVYKRLIISLSNFFKHFGTTEKYEEKNLNQINTAITKWTSSQKNITIPNYKKGDVYKIEFGLAYEPELAYEHRGIIIGKRNNLYYVLPITTYNHKKHKNVYHPTLFPNGNKDYYLLKGTEYPGLLDHDSVIKCYDLKTVSYKRFVGKVGVIAEPYLRLITKCAYKNIFPTIDYETQQQITNLRNQLEEKQEEKEEVAV